MYVKRLDQIRAAMRQQNLDGFIVCTCPQMRYLCGFHGHDDPDGLLVILPDQALLLTDFRYTDEARKFVKGARVHIVTVAKTAALKDFPILTRRHLRFGFQPGTVTVAVVDQIHKALPDALLVPNDDILAELGWVKDKEEQATIQKAVDISDAAFERIINLVKPGVREKELAAELEYQMMMLGSEKPAFETIVASGYRSAMPHGLASAKKLRKGEFVTFDFGAMVDGYVSDITRTVVVGKASPRHKKIYGIVARAQLAAIRKMRPGASGKAVDKAARDIITAAGFGKNFGHGTGHGIGIVIHTGPSLSPRIDPKLKSGNIITCEPGIYISGWGGVRIEDDVLITRTGHRVLNRAPKNLLEL